jgi:thiamine pyrophosphokinase
MKQKKHTHALIICNGEMPSSKLLLPLLKTKPFIVCADGGANKVRAFRIVPDCIIGDLDSITQKTRLFFSFVPIIHNPDQDSTDLEKVLEYLLANHFASATIVGATGERPDHTMANFSILLKYHRKIALQFFDERCTIEIVQNKIRFHAVIGQQISLVPMGKCSGITTKGLKYLLKNESLELGPREGSSNEAAASTIDISLKSGSLLLFKIHPHIKH